MVVVVFVPFVLNWVAVEVFVPPVVVLLVGSGDRAEFQLSLMPPFLVVWPVVSVVVQVGVLRQRPRLV